MNLTTEVSITDQNLSSVQLEGLGERVAFTQKKQPTQKEALAPVDCGRGPGRTPLPRPRVRVGVAGGTLLPGLAGCLGAG